MLGSAGGTSSRQNAGAIGSHIAMSAVEWMSSLIVSHRRRKASFRGHYFGKQDWALSAIVGAPKWVVTNPKV